MSTSNSKTNSVWVMPPGSRPEMVEDVEEVPVDPVLAMFTSIGQAFNERNAAWQECFNISRKITYDSKRAISQVLGYYQKPKAMQHAGYNFYSLIVNDTHFPGLAKRLYNWEDYLFFRYNFISAAIQEYTEALALFTFFKEGRLITYDEVQSKLTFTWDEEQGAEEEGMDPVMIPVTYAIPVSKTDFYLGLADVTGELVRACVAGLHQSNFKFFLFSATALVRSLFMCLQTLYPFPKGLNSKLTVMRGSIIKLETVCFHCTIAMERFVSFSGMAILAKNESGIGLDDEGEDESPRGGERCK